MCGIFFYNSVNPITPQQSQEIFRAVALLTHRGPEAMKCELIDAHTIVGFTFLPIVTGKESKGLQPFRYDDGWILLCNGEIYNHKELTEGIDTQSDVESIYYALKKYGKSTFQNYLNGEYAFVMYNEQTKEYIKGRDPYGIRAFHQAKTPIITAYASEMKALYPLFNPADISHVIPLKNNFIQNTINTHPLNELFNAVERRISPNNMNREYAFLLSGGLDSSIICAMALSLTKNKKIRTFCLSIGDEDGTDLKYARKFVQMYKDSGIIHTEVKISIEDAISSIPDVIKTIETFDVTTVRASVGQYLVCKYIKEHFPEIGALIVGEGADELLGGYAYSIKGPSNKDLLEDSSRLLAELYRYDCKRVDMCVSRFGMEARTPFLDLKFAKGMEDYQDRFEFDKMKETKLTKIIMREKFSHLLPEELLNRPKEAFSDGIMSHTNRKNSWYGAIQDHSSSLGFTEKEWYKYIFDQYYKGCEHLVPKYWMPRWTDCQSDDPSALIYMS